MKPLIVFDLDGTLVDSRRDIAESANDVLASYGAKPLALDEVGRMVGEGARVLIERVIAARSLDSPIDEALERFVDIYERRLTNHTRPYPGVIDALDALAPLATLAVFTNKPARHTTLLLDALGLSHYFLTAVGIDGSIPRKPDPTGLLRIIDLARTRATVTIMVGDSPVDVETARRAGTRLCRVLYGLGEFDLAVPLSGGAIDVTDSRELKEALLRAILEPEFQSQ
jgi:phosphoglycolate phosphatase